MVANGTSLLNGTAGRSHAPPSQSDYKQYLPDLSDPRFTTMAAQDAHQYASGLLEDGEPYWLAALVKHWRRLFTEPYHGITTDGGPVRPGLFAVADEGVDVGAIACVASSFLDSLTPDQRARTLLHVDSPEWRSWSNPEFLISDKGVRLDAAPAEVRERALAMVRATLSPEGYARARAAMRLNGHLGELVGAPAVMNEHSYNVVVFGAPSATRPWGWALYGHHLCLNVFLYRRQLVASPCFTGAEPATALDADGRRILLLEEEETMGLRLMQGLPEPLRRRARTYRRLRDPAMPPGRWNRDDQRHLCGAYRDNRVVPYEGVTVADMPDPAQRDLVWDICRRYLLHLPRSARDAKMASVTAFPRETYFSWIGGYADHDAFYFRIQSPVILLEFDHHSGVFLTNEEPAKFHVHTILRTPNAGDYGMALRPQIPPPEDFFEAVL